MPHRYPARLPPEQPSALRDDAGSEPRGRAEPVSIAVAASPGRTGSAAIDRAGLPAQTDGRRWQDLIGLGLIAMIAGMCAFPAGPSLNPGKPYQYLIGLGLYLPALILGATQRWRWRAFARRPLIPATLVLAAWAMLSLGWSNTVRPLDEVLRVSSILVFLFAWFHGVGEVVERQQRVLIAGAGALVLTAIAAMIHFLWNPPVDGRLLGFGVMANPNLLAASLGAGLLWLWPLRFPLRWQRLLKWSALVLLAVAVLQTHSRSAGAALFIAVFVLTLIQPIAHRQARTAILLLGGALVALAAYPLLIARGWSFRPEILGHAWELFLQHPWRGLGLGAQFQIPAHGMQQTHTHNLFTQVAVELGLPGLLLWSLLWLALGWRAWRARALVTGQIVLGLWVFATVLVQFDLPHLLDSPRPGWLIIWLPLALSLSLPETRRRNTAAEP